MQWDSHRLHSSGTEHYRWFAHHLRSNPYSPWSGGAYVGRTGTLAVALGIGTAAVTGSCWACASATADTGDRESSSGGSNTSTSQSVEARRGPRVTASSVGGGSLRAPGGANHRTTPARSAAPTELRINLPDATMTPSAAVAAQPVAIGDMYVSIATEQVPPPSSYLSPDPNATPKVFQPAAMPLRPAVVIASPAAASPALATTFTNVLTTLSTTLKGGGAPTVPADASLALALGTARRETSAMLRSAAAKSAKTTVVAATATTNTSSTATTTAEAEKMTRSGSTRVVSDNKASGRYALVLSGVGTISTTISLPDSAVLKLRLKAASGAPDMTLSIDGIPYTTLMVTSTSYTDYTFAGGISPGKHEISVSSTTATTTNKLFVDSLTTTSGPIVEQFTGKSGSAPSNLWTRRSGTGFDASTAIYAPGNAVLDGQGNLAIVATRGENGRYTSGWVWTKNNMTFGYGTITARVKMPQGQGLWPAIWLMGADSDVVGWPTSGEIDVAELPSTTTTVYSTLHGPIAGSTGTQQAQIVSKVPDLSADFHNYWVTHMQHKIVFGIDGQTLGTLTPADLAPGAVWVYNRPMYLIINLAVGGPWAGAPDSTTPSTAKMLVDSVTFVPA